MIAGSDDGIPDDVPVKYLRKKLEERKRAQEMIHKKTAELSERASKLGTSIGEGISDLQRKIEELEKYKKRLTEINLRLGSKYSLTLTILSRLDEEMKNIESLYLFKSKSDYTKK